MKNEGREYPMFALCGLKCGLCPIHNMENGCPGCGGGLGHQPCRIYRCAKEKGNIEYCFECAEFPCKEYDGMTEHDSFILHRNMINDLNRAKEVGINEYTKDLDERIIYLKKLLLNYNAGRKKSFYCLALNLLEIEDIRDIMEQLKKNDDKSLDVKEREAIAVDLFNEKAIAKEIILKLNKKKKEK